MARVVPWGRMAIGLLVSIACNLGGSARAMTFETVGTTLFASGPIRNDFPAFEAALKKNTAIKTLVLVNSPGGDLDTSVKIGDLVAARKLDTIAAGRCVSACTVIFVRGVNRSFSNAWPSKETYLGIHGPHDAESKRPSRSAAEMLFDYYKRWLGKRFDEAFFKKALYEMEEAGVLVKIYDPVRSKDTPPKHCPSQFKPGLDCTYFKDHDAYSLGLVTQKDLVNIELPKDLQSLTEVIGIALTTPLESPEALLAQSANGSCISPDCRSTLAKLLTVPPISAVALSSAGTAFLVDGKDNTTEALLSVMSACNYPSALVTQLCEVQVVDGMDTRGLYKDEAVLQSKAIADLVVPSAKYFADEADGSSFWFNGRLKTTADISETPTSLDGISTIHTRALASALKSGTPPRLIAVGAKEGAVLPGASWLEQGGTAFDLPVIEREIEKRFVRIMRLLAPQLDQPLVFYCYGPDSWLSVNAALRAKKMGYRNIYWYRGGLAAWREAKLPTLVRAPRAVLSI